MTPRRLTIIATVLIFSGCQQPTASDTGIEEAEFERIQIINIMAAEIWVLAAELQLSHRIDPIPQFDLDALGQPPVWSWGEQKAIEEIDGYIFGDDVRLFVYTRKWVAENDRKEEKIVLGQLKDVTHAELLETAGHIALTFATISD